MGRTWSALGWLALASCGGDGLGLFCSESGCGGMLVLTVVDEADAPVPALAGTIALRDRTFAVDCAGLSDPEVICEGGTITVTLTPELGGQDVVLDLQRDGVTVTSRVDLDWQRFDPNGRSCSPTCWTAEGTVRVDDPSS